jgi:DNA-binding response OmpR family regulator
MKTQILVVGRHEEILQTVVRLINKNEQWEAKSTLDDAEAIKLFDTFDFDIVLLTNGISENCEDSLCLYFKDKKPSIKIIQHYGGGSGLLSNEILQALHTPAVSIT